MVFTTIGSHISKLFSTTTKTVDAVINNPAYRARNFGSNSFLKRAGVASMYLTPGIGLAIGSGKTEDRLRNYYGEERFTSYFGGGFDTLKTLGIVGGATGAGFAFMGSDPLSRLGRSIYRQDARMKLKTASKIFFSLTGKTRGAALSGRGRAGLLESGSDFTQLGRKSAMYENLRFTGDASAYGPYPLVFGGMPKSSRFIGPRSTKIDYVKKRHPIGLRDQADDFIGPPVRDDVMGTARKNRIEALAGPNAKRTRARDIISSARRDLNSLLSQPGLGFKSFLGVSAILLGVSPTQVLEKVGIPAEKVAVLAGFAGVAVGGTKIAKAGGLPVTAVSAGLASVVGMSASRVSENMPEEGNITDISVSNRGRDGVSKMNFSTAGLVFALHNANRRYQ